jgi:hypothetical protein
MKEEMRLADCKPLQDMKILKVISNQPILINRRIRPIQIQKKILQKLWHGNIIQNLLPEKKKKPKLIPPMKKVKNLKFLMTMI